MVTSPGGTRHNILRSAADIMCSQGEGGLRVAAVAAAAAVNKRMIYHYFGDREGLLSAVYQQQSVVLLAAPRGVREESKRVLRVLLGALVDELPSDGAAPRGAAAVETLDAADALALQCAAKILLPYLVYNPVEATIGAFGADQWRVFCEDLVSLALPGWLASKRSLRSKKPVYRLPSASRPRI